LLVANVASLISAGTERQTIALARRSLVGKARQRPEQFRRVLEKLQSEGIGPTLRQVRARLDRPVALGYSSAGSVIEVGREVQGFRVGDRVACAAPHAEVVAVGSNLAARIADEVSFAEACYGVVGAIALHALRVGHVGLGQHVAIIGLGLVGQLAVGLAKAAGAAVIGCDPDASRRQTAQRMGAGFVAAPRDFEPVVHSATGGIGADVVVIAASTASGGLLDCAGRVARSKGRIVVVGQFPMTVPRRTFYDKELRLVVSRSTGPGRYDPEFEDRGCDYPIEHVRWTGRRNLEAVLAQIAAGRLDVTQLTSHRFPIADAEEAYALLNSRSHSSLGIVLVYPGASSPPEHRGTRLHRSQATAVPCVSSDGAIARRITRWVGGFWRAPRAAVGVSVIGAGSFAADTWLPLLARAEGVHLRGLCSAGGMSAAVLGRKYGFSFATTRTDDIWNDDATTIVVIAVRHDLHVPFGLAALRAGKNVLVEKPLAISPVQWLDWQRGIADLGDACPLWTVGFNRRFSPASRALRQAYSHVVEPKLLSIRMNVGPIPADHWANDAEVGGGRIIGEACHAVDLATWLTGSLPVRVSADAVANRTGIREDQAVLTLCHADGSVSTIVFTSGGHRRAGKERVEVFGGGCTGLLDDFLRLAVYRPKRRTLRRRWWSQQKGFAEQWAAFRNAIDGPEPPIPYKEVHAVTEATLSGVVSLRRRSPVLVGSLALTPNRADLRQPENGSVDSRPECSAAAHSPISPSHEEHGCRAEPSRH
jgi:predicted dehydrogenase